MDTTPRLSLPYIAAAQAQKHVTHNEAIRTLDALVHLSAVSRDVLSPPTQPSEGQCFIIGDGATGLWAGKDKQIAAWQDSGWAYTTPRSGFSCWVEDEAAALRFTGGVWQSQAGTLAGSEALQRLGVNAQADDTNRLAVNTDAVLLSHDTAPDSGDVRLVLNKKAEADTNSLIFQTAYAGRAEMGLAGNDDFAIRTSADAVAWTTALQFDGATAHASFGDVTDPDANLSLTAEAPLVRFSSSSATVVTVALADARARTSNYASMSYDCADKDAMFSLNGVDVLTLGDRKLQTPLPIRSEAIVYGEHLYTNARVIIAGNGDAVEPPEVTDPGTSTNLDHIWNDGAANEWHFCSGASYKAAGNATVRAASFATTSDWRLKDDVTRLDHEAAVEMVRNLRPVKFRWRPDSGQIDNSQADDGLRNGFIAHEVATTIPSATRGKKDDMASDGKTPIYQSVDHQQIIAPLVSALQQAFDRIDALEARLADG